MLNVYGALFSLLMPCVVLCGGCLGFKNGLQNEKTKIRKQNLWHSDSESRIVLFVVSNRHFLSARLFFSFFFFPLYTFLLFLIFRYSSIHFLAFLNSSLLLLFIVSLLFFPLSFFPLSFFPLSFSLPYFIAFHYVFYTFFLSFPRHISFFSLD